MPATIQTYFIGPQIWCLQAYLKYKAWLHTQHCVTVKMLCSDYSGEYLSTDFSNHLTNQGTLHRLMFTTQLSKNGVLERLNRTPLEHTCEMLHASSPPKIPMWGSYSPCCAFKEPHINKGAECTNTIWSTYWCQTQSCAATWMGSGALVHTISQSKLTPELKKVLGGF